MNEGKVYRFLGTLRTTGTKHAAGAYRRGNDDMKLSRFALLAAVLVPVAAFAQGGGGGGGSAGGGTGGGATSGATGASSTNENASSATGSSGPSGNAATGNTNNQTTGNTNSQATSRLPNHQTVNGNGLSTGLTPGTNTAGTAAPSGAPGASAQNTAPAGGIGKPTTTNEQDSDAQIDRENNKADKTVGKICKNC
ncbi:hypothetical protein ACRQ5Q_41615 (plasmid) [Bradyrhizobium sp. PMVTL-01]|uniref:hypothetical protein n=1 Tax=Bradyrhizobium sp. PMVTL-01 TaxID=3434999 RepID=UPI003F6E579A